MRDFCTAVGAPTPSVNEFQIVTEEQGADSCELVSFCGLLNQTEKNRTDWTETGQEKAAIFRRGTNALGQKKLGTPPFSRQKIATNDTSTPFPDTNSQ